MNEGDLVRCTYKTGTYLGEVFNLRSDSKTAVVKILAVVKHPLQGDLHNPGKTDVPLFHERRALSYTEKANVPLTHIKPYSGTIPPYPESLAQAVSEYEEKLSKDDSAFSAASNKALAQIKKSYTFQP
jgi:kinase-associated protein B